MTGLHLTSADQGRLATASEALLSPLAADTLDEWRLRVCRTVKALLGADMVTFQFPVAGEVALFSEDVDPAYLRHYLDTLAPVETELVPPSRFPTLKVYDRKRLWGDRLEDYHRTEYYNACIRPARAFDALSAAVPLREGATGPRMSGKGPERGMAILYHHHDSPDRTPFGERGSALLRMLYPAFEMGVRTRMRYRERWGPVLQMLDRMEDAAVLADRDGRIVHENRALGEIDADDPGGAEVREALRLLARSLAARDGIEPLLAPRTPRREGSPPPFVDTPRGRYRLRGAFLDDPERASRRMAVAWTAPPDRALPDPEELEERHGLTPRQAEVALLLANRHSTGEIARRLDISPHTVRRHIEQVFLKLGVHSRRNAGRVVRGEV